MDNGNDKYCFRDNCRIWNCRDNIVVNNNIIRDNFRIYNNIVGNINFIKYSLVIIIINIINININ